MARSAMTWTAGPHLLVVDSDSQRLRFLARSLKDVGYSVETAVTASDAVTRAAFRPPDALIVDVDLADGHGIDVCQEIRNWSSAAVLLLSARRDENEVVAGLNAGADDYIATPVSLDELHARLRAVMRRAHPSTEAEIVVGDLRIDLANRRVFVAGMQVQLTKTQFKVLRTLARHPGKLVTHRMLTEAVWGSRHFSSPNLLYAHVWQLRQKIELEPSNPRYVITERGCGFRLRDPEVLESAVVTDFRGRASLSTLSSATAAPPAAA